jgi:hypothetical protein
MVHSVSIITYGFRRILGNGPRHCAIHGQGFAQRFVVSPKPLDFIRRRRDFFRQELVTLNRPQQFDYIQHFDLPSHSSS